MLSEQPARSEAGWNRSWRRQAGRDERDDGPRMGHAPLPCGQAAPASDVQAAAVDRLLRRSATEGRWNSRSGFRPGRRGGFEFIPAPGQRRASLDAVTPSRYRRRLSTKSRALRYRPLPRAAGRDPPRRNNKPSEPRAVLAARERLRGAGDARGFTRTSRARPSSDGRSAAPLKTQ